ncbi:MAG: S-layer homology domain-containing protein [Chloroflexota bacterium]|nr:S-layer homology domain-containing protein [Chloroflexota bacterium]
MKRVFAAAGLVALCTFIGVAEAKPAANIIPPGNAPAFNFASPLKTSEDYSGVGRIAAGSDGSVNVLSPKGQDITYDTNRGFYQNNFSTNALDSSTTGIGNVTAHHDGMGRVWANWFHSYGDGSSNVVRGIKDPGTNNTPWDVATVPGSDTFPPNPYKVADMATTTSGRAYVMYARNTVGVSFQYSDDGVHWSGRTNVPGPFGPSAADFAIGASKDGAVMIGWTDRSTTDVLVQLRDAAGNWGPVTDISRVNHQGYAPRFASDAFGGIRIIWMQVNPDTGSGSDVWYREWTPTGGWNPNLVRLFATSGNTAGHGYNISVDSSGTAHIVYQDDTRLGGVALSYYITGQGTTFSRPQQLFQEFGSAAVRFPDVDASTVTGHGEVAHVVGNSNYDNGGYFANWYSYTDVAATTPPTVTPTTTATPIPCTPGQFSDVNPTDYFYDAVNYLVARNVISGYSDCTFKPYNNTTRGQVAKIVALGFNVPAYVPPLGGYTFADVPPNYVFFAQIEAANHAGIISGYDCGTRPTELCDAFNRRYFRPGDLVTRGQLAKIVVGAAGWTLRNPATPTFTDVPPSNVFYQAVETAVCHGIISGYNDGTFKPANNATRGQVSKIVYLALTSGQTACANPTATVTVTSTAVPPSATTTSVVPTVTATGTPPTVTSTAVPPTVTVTSTPTATATATSILPTITVPVLTATPTATVTVTVTATP